VLSIYSAKERITTVAEKDRVAIKDEETGQRLTLEAREVFEQYHADERSGCEYVRYLPTSAPRQACPDCGREVSSRAKACPKCGFPLDDADALTEAMEEHATGAKTTGDRCPHCHAFAVQFTTGI
jgi:uncharacterized protein with PIN domain